MQAVTWHGAHDLRVEERYRPALNDPYDAIIAVSSTCIGGSDQLMFGGQYTPGAVMKGNVVGHEFMGYVHEVGSQVTSLRVGDRVVVAYDAACGRCTFCARQLYTDCCTMNPAKIREVVPLDGKSAGKSGDAASHNTVKTVPGHLEGGQADFVRVPFADVNCLKIPPDMHDDQVVLLSDVLPTAWHATELGEVKPGDVVAIWGAGPVGLLAAQCCWFRGAKRVIIIDKKTYMLQFAKHKMPNIETIDLTDSFGVVDRLRHLCLEGPDVCIDAVMSHMPKSLGNRIVVSLGMTPTTPPTVLQEMIQAAREGGHLAVVSAYVGSVKFDIAEFMEKGLTLRCSDTPVQKYWQALLQLVRENKLNPSIIITHALPLASAPKAYRMFDKDEYRCIKVVLKPDHAPRATPVAPGIGGAADGAAVAAIAGRVPGAQPTVITPVQPGISSPLNGMTSPGRGAMVPASGGFGSTSMGGGEGYLPIEGPTNGAYDGTEVNRGGMGNMAGAGMMGAGLGAGAMGAAQHMQHSAQPSAQYQQASSLQQQGMMGGMQQQGMMSEQRPQLTTVVPTPTASRNQTETGVAYSPQASSNFNSQYSGGRGFADGAVNSPMAAQVVHSARPFASSGATSPLGSQGRMTGGGTTPVGSRSVSPGNSIGRSMGGAGVPLGGGAGMAGSVPVGSRSASPVRGQYAQSGAQMAGLTQGSPTSGRYAPLQQQQGTYNDSMQRGNIRDGPLRTALSNRMPGNVTVTGNDVNTGANMGYHDSPVGTQTVGSTDDSSVAHEPVIDNNVNAANNFVDNNDRYTSNVPVSYTTSMPSSAAGNEGYIGSNPDSYSTGNSGYTANTQHVAGSDGYDGLERYNNNARYTVVGRQTGNTIYSPAGVDNYAAKDRYTMNNEPYAESERSVDNEAVAVNEKMQTGGAASNYFTKLPQQ